LPNLDLLHIAHHRAIRVQKNLARIETAPTGGYEKGHITILAVLQINKLFGSSGLNYTAPCNDQYVRILAKCLQNQRPLTCSVGSAELLSLIGKDDPLVFLTNCFDDLAGHRLGSRPCAGQPSAPVFLSRRLV